MGTWSEELLERLSKAIEGLDEDELDDAVRENIDIGDLVSEIMEKDEDVKAAFRAKIKQKLLEHIEKWDPDEFDDTVSDADIEKETKRLFAEDEEVRQAFRVKMRELVLEKIENITEMDELNRDFDLSKHLPKNLVRDMARDMFKPGDPDDPEEEDSPLAKIREIIQRNIDNLNDDDILPEWNEFVNMLGLEAVTKRLLAEGALQASLSDRMKELIEEKIGNLDGDDLPDNALDLMGLQDRIRNTLADPSFDQMITQQMGEIVQRALVDALRTGDDKVTVMVLSSPRVQALLGDGVVELLQDVDRRDQIKEGLIREMQRQSREGGVLFNALVGKMAEVMIGRLFDDRR